jgi:hypothetical protein
MKRAHLKHHKLGKCKRVRRAKAKRIAFKRPPFTG